MRKFWKALAVLSVLGFLWGGASCSHSSSSDTSDSSPSENETEATVSAVTVSGSSAVAVGAVIQLTAAVTMSDESAYDGTVTWKSSDSAVATVDASGILTGVAEGNVAITASAGGVTSSAFAVTVSETVQTAISSVSISGSSSIQYNGSSDVCSSDLPGLFRFT